MNKLIFVPVIFAASFVLQLFMPWWSMAIACFAVCYILRPGLFAAFAGSLLAVLVLWMIKSWYSDRSFDMPVSSILGSIFGNLSGSMMYLLTGLTGGLVAGFSGLCGTWSSRIWLARDSED